MDPKLLTVIPPHMPLPHTVIVEVSGGCITSVRSTDTSINVVIIDHDVLDFGSHEWEGAEVNILDVSVEPLDRKFTLPEPIDSGEQS